MNNLIEPFKKNPLFLDLKGKFLSSVVSSLPKRDVEGFLLMETDVSSYIFFLKDSKWDGGIQWSSEHILPSDPSSITFLCDEKGSKASFFQGRIELLDIILDRFPHKTLLSEASSVTPAILTLLIEGVEEDVISAYFKLEWHNGPIGYILMREGEIIQRVFIENDVIIGDEAGKIIIEYLEGAPCDISVYQIPAFELDGLEESSGEGISREEEDDIDDEVDETLEEYEQSLQKSNFVSDAKAEPRNFKRDYAARYNEENKNETSMRKKGEDLKSKKEKEDKNDTPESVSRYAFPLFNKKPTDKMIKTFSSPPAAEKQEEQQDKSSLPSFKDHVLSTYFSMAESHEMKGEKEKACSVLEEALEVPQIDKLAVYRYLLSMYKRYNMIDNELDVLRRMAADFKSDHAVLSWVNRQIAVTYVRKGNKPPDTPEISGTPSQTSHETPPKGGFLSKIFGKDKK